MKRGADRAAAVHGGQHQVVRYQRAGRSAILPGLGTVRGGRPSRSVCRRTRRAWRRSPASPSASRRSRSSSTTEPPRHLGRCAVQEGVVALRPAAVREHSLEADAAHGRQGESRQRDAGDVLSAAGGGVRQSPHRLGIELPGVCRPLSPSCCATRKQALAVSVCRRPGVDLRQDRANALSEPGTRVMALVADRPVASNLEERQ